MPESNFHSSSSTVTKAPNPYDLVPYESYPFPKSHIRHLHTIARLFALTPPPLDGCRVLELGGASGGNLIPMAIDHPGSQFLGIDLSPRQIEMGQRQIADLGLKNIELRTVSIMDIDASFGAFDYIVAHMNPADEVGGDYYDILSQDGRAKFGIGDVTGHGLESGVLMLMVQSVARALYESGEVDSKRFLEILNRTIFKNVARMKSGKHLTLAFVDYDRNKITITGQHEEVIVIRRDGQIERFDTVDLGFPVGLEDDIAPFVASHELGFEQGDVLVLHTDGITEAANEQGEMFGLERLCDSAARHSAGTAADIKNGIIRDLLDHVGTRKFDDDITLVVIKHL